MLELDPASSDEDQARLANLAWLAAAGAARVRVVADDEDAVYALMQKLWESAPKYASGSWTHPTF